MSFPNLVDLVGLVLESFLSDKLPVRAVFLGFATDGDFTAGSDVSCRFRLFPERVAR